MLRPQEKVCRADFFYLIPENTPENCEFVYLMLRIFSMYYPENRAQKEIIVLSNGAAVRGAGASDSERKEYMQYQLDTMRGCEVLGGLVFQEGAGSQACGGAVYLLQFFCYPLWRRDCAVVPLSCEMSCSNMNW